MDEVLDVGHAPQATLDSILADPAASASLKYVLLSWASRDAVDAVNDAEILVGVLRARAKILTGGSP